MIKLLLILSLLCPSFALGKTLHPEKWYQKNWCTGQPATLYDNVDGKTRVFCDCVTDTHAIEFDFAKKWPEAIGQSLYYAKLTGKRAGIYLILESPKDFRHWKRLTYTIRRYRLPIDIWAIGGGLHKGETK